MRLERAALALVLAMLVLVGLMTWADNAPAAPESQWSAREQVDVIATGSAGVASGTVTSNYLHGYIRAIYVDYAASISTTTDITITTNSPSATVLLTTDTYTDAWYYPSVQFTGNTGSAVSGAYGQFPVNDYLSIDVAETTAGTVAVLTIEYGE